MKNVTAKLSSKEACTLAHKIRRETGCSLSEAFKAVYSNTPVAPKTPKTSWTAEELNKIFSDKAAELIRKGYVIDLGGMSGHQGEIGKVVFKKGNDYYVLVMESKNAYAEGIYTEHYVIRFGKYTEKVDKIALDTWFTFWLERFDTIWSLEFVKISNNYFTTIEEAKVANQKWIERCQNNRSNRIEEVSSKYNAVILACVRKQKGYKTVKASEIVDIVRIIPYNDFKHRFDRGFYRVTLSRTNKFGKNITLKVER